MPIYEAEILQTTSTTKLTVERTKVTIEAPSAGWARIALLTLGDDGALDGRDYEFVSENEEGDDTLTSHEVTVNPEPVSADRKPDFRLDD